MVNNVGLDAIGHRYLSVSEEPGLRIRCTSGCNCEERVAIDCRHPSSLALPVLCAVLNNTERVDPDIPHLKGSGDLDEVSEHRWQPFKRYAAQVRLDTCCRCSNEVSTSPAVAETHVAGPHVGYMLTQLDRFRVSAADFNHSGRQEWIVGVGNIGAVFMLCETTAQPVRSQRKRAGGRCVFAEASCPA